MTFSFFPMHGTSPSMNDMDPSTPSIPCTILSDDNIVSKTNEILAFCELQPRFCSISDIQENTSSICVAILERLLQQKLSNINRNPKCNADYVQNAHIFLDKLQTGFLQIHLPPFVTAEQLCNGNKHSISQILLILTKLVRLLSHVRANENVLQSRDSRPEEVSGDLSHSPIRSNYDADDDISENLEQVQGETLRNATTQQQDEERTDLDELNENESNDSHLTASTHNGNNRTASLSESPSCSRSESCSGLETMTQTATNAETESVTPSMTRSTTSMETDEADRSPLHRPAGFGYNLGNTPKISVVSRSTENKTGKISKSSSRSESMSSRKPRRKLKRKSSGQLSGISSRSRRGSVRRTGSTKSISRSKGTSVTSGASTYSSTSLQSVRSSLSALSSRSSSRASFNRRRPQSAYRGGRGNRPRSGTRRRPRSATRSKRGSSGKAQNPKVDGVYKKILSPRLSLKHKNDKLYKYAMKQSKLTKQKRTNRRRNRVNQHLAAYTKKNHLDENGLIRIIKGQQQEKVRADLRWLSKMEGELERELLLRTMRQKSEEQVAIEKVQAEAKKLEKEYLRNYYREYKRKFEMLRNDLESKTQSISSFFRAQYNVLNEEKEALNKFHESQHYSQKVELSQLKQELKSKKEAQLKNLCQMISTLNLNDGRDLNKLNKMIKQTVGTQQ